MTEELLLVERRDAVAVVTLNRPRMMNALSGDLCAALVSAIRTLDRDASIAVIVLTGAGDRAFTAGLDLKELGEAGGEALDRLTSDPLCNPVNAIARCSKPVIAAVNGVAVTGGFEIALACDIIVASETARFADTHVKVGVLPGWGLSQRLSRLIGPSRAKEMSFTGRFIDAQTAAAWGLVNHVVGAARLLDEAIDLANEIASRSPTMIARYKALIDEGFALPLGEGLRLESNASTTFNAAIAADKIEERRSQVIQSNRS